MPMRVSGLKIKNGNKVNFRVISVKTEPETPQTPVYWITPSNLGSFPSDEEFFIETEFSDDQSILVNITLVSGELPDGVLLNQIDGSLSGTASVLETYTYHFGLALNYNGGSVVRDFSMTIEGSSSEIVWNTDENLGEFDGGAGISQSLSARSAKK